jgi:hypothetical protein
MDAWPSHVFFFRGIQKIKGSGIRLLERIAQLNFLVVTQKVDHVGVYPRPAKRTNRM